MRQALISAIRDGCTQDQAIERMTADGLYYPSAAVNFIRMCGVSFPTSKEMSYQRQQELQDLSIAE